MPAGEQPRGSGRGVARRRFLQVLGGLSLAGGVSYLTGRGVPPRPGAGGGAARGACSHRGRGHARPLCRRRHRLDLGLARPGTKGPATRHHPAAGADLRGAVAGLVRLLPAGRGAGMSRRGWSLGRAGRAVAAALRDRRARRAAVVVAVAYLLVYLLAVGDVTVSLASDLSRFVELPSLQVAPDWTAKLLGRRGAFSYEPVLALYPVNHVTVFVAPLDLAMGLLLGALAGLNLAVALLGWRASRACRLRACPGCSAPYRRCSPGHLLRPRPGAGARRAVHLRAARGQGLAVPLALAVTTISLVWSAQQTPRPPERPAARRRNGSRRPAPPPAPRRAPRPARPPSAQPRCPASPQGEGPARPVLARVGWPCGRSGTPAARTHRWAVYWATP